MTFLYDNRTNEEISNEDYGIIERVVKETLKYEQYINEAEISISFVTNDEIRELNKQYRWIDKVTDVLSFPLGGTNPETDEVMLGDIVLSLDKAREQADIYGHAFRRELGFLTVHSVLHLLGYDHINEDEEKVMFTRQEEILKRVGLIR
ncbi:MAG: rRNA maturation RNase YbeY [Clostridiales bacterium GWE2_32_10]|nr:MAG: rRNA maturation RNase YbeY [Clostridiales bacterium GWE2_32_10]HBY20465.1 rRNA maturation RNase YbeY [Clostridiales bacterium]